MTYESKYKDASCLRFIAAWMLWGMASTSSPRWAAFPVGLGVLLRNARVDAGLSCRALARAVDRSHAWVRDLEAGARPPSTTMAGRVSEALNLDPWADAVLRSVAVDDVQLSARQATR